MGSNVFSDGAVSQMSVYMREPEPIYRADGKGAQCGREW